MKHTDEWDWVNGHPTDVLPPFFSTNGINRPNRARPLQLLSNTISVDRAERCSRLFELAMLLTCE
jgi:hypothetical protein